jgi:valyl-tRNA synthetase
MPFITEELWARMAEHATPRRSMLMLSPWPELAALPAELEPQAEMGWLIELISGIRSVRSEMHVPPAARIGLVLKHADDVTALRLNRYRDIILTMGRLSNARVSADIPAGSAQFIVGEAIAALPLGDVIDLAQERARLQKDLKKAEDEMARFDSKLNNPAFVSRAPEEVIEEQREKRAEAAALAARLGEALNRLSA